MAALLCAILLAGGQAVSAQAPAASNGSWTSINLPVQSTVSFLEGTVEEFAVDDNGNTVWQVRRTGDSEDAPLINVTIDSNTEMDFEGNVANGDIIGVEYIGELVVREEVVHEIRKQPDGSIVLSLHLKEDPSQKNTMRFNASVARTVPQPMRGDVYTSVYVEGTGRKDAALLAERVSKHTPLPMVMSSGVVKELLPGGYGADGGFLMQQDDGMDIIFHYGPETKISTSSGKITAGSRLNVAYNGILTRSLPPQGFASEITDYDAPAALK